MLFSSSSSALNVSSVASCSSVSSGCLRPVAASSDSSEAIALRDFLQRFFLFVDGGKEDVANGCVAREKACKLMLIVAAWA